MFDDETTNLHVNLGDDAEEVIGIVTSKGECLIDHYVSGGFEEPSLRVYIERGVIERHISSPVREEIVQTALNLKIEGVGIGNQVKVYFVGLFQKLIALFAD